MEFRFGVRVLGIVLALFVCTGVASADSISGGDLFGVFANSGSFSTAAGSEFEAYTIVHFVTFAASPISEFPDMLVPEAFPAAFFPTDFGFLPDSQFFFLGSLNGLGADPDHLLLSNSNPGQVPSSAVDEPLHSQLVAGAQALTDGLPIGTMTAADFWSLFDAENPFGIADQFFGMTQFGPDGPVSQLSDYAWSDGSEALFGFNPPYQLGTINGSVYDYSFTNAAGATFTPVPEPSTLALMAGVLALGFGIRRRALGCGIRRGALGCGIRRGRRAA